MEGVGKILRRRAREHGWSDAEVARRVGIQPRRYSNYVNDEREPPFEMLIEICRVLDLAPNDLFGFQPPLLGSGESGGYVYLPLYDVEAAAGHGTVVDAENISARLAFKPDWLRSVTSAPTEALGLITVYGDSMLPTLINGDTILVDFSSAHLSRDGIYVLRRDGMVQVKRISIHPGTGRLTIASDNTAYETWRDLDAGSIDIAGRVIWLGRRI
jgi:transcriptional regulator with XRE-family HTH domain